jgi:hypothetical protein
MKPTPAMVKRRKVAATKEVRQNRGGARRKRATPKAASKKITTKETPYKWSTSRGDKDENEAVPDEHPAVKASSTAAIMSSNSDNSETDSEDEVDEESEDGVSEHNTTRSTTIDPSPTGNETKKTLFVQPSNHSVETLKESVEKLQSRNSMLSRQIKNVTKMGSVDRYEVMQLRKMVKENLFKKVKFITTTATEKKCLQYLVSKLNITPEIQRDWCATYASCVRGAINNKRNNVSQDLKMEIKGKKRPKWEGTMK